jgi:hypothetical protein
VFYEHFGFSLAVSFHQCPERISFVYHICYIYSIMFVRDTIKYKTFLLLQAFTSLHRAKGCTMAQVVTLQHVTEET